MLNLRPTKPAPLRTDQARDELLRLWEGLDPQGRYLVLAHVRAVAEVTAQLRQRGDAAS